jgi:hypothetical protein
MDRTVLLEVIQESKLPKNRLIGQVKRQLVQVLPTTLPVITPAATRTEVTSAAGSFLLLGHVESRVRPDKKPLSKVQFLQAFQ